MIPKNIEAVIFDFDGIIVDTEQVGVSVSSDLMKRKFAVDLTEADKHSFYGLQDERFYQALFEKYCLTADVDEIMREHNAHYDTAIFQIRQPLSGVREVLSKIQQRELPAAICSGSYEHQIRTILANLELAQYFSSVTSCEETQQHKPHPEPYLVAAQKLGINPTKCLVFEDSENGVVSAKKAGMYCIGVKIGNHGTQDLSRADRVVNTLNKLL